MLRSQVRLLIEQNRVSGALHLLERFHAYDAIQNDSCPCCGARVEAVEDPDCKSGVLLRAVT